MANESDDAEALRLITAFLAVRDSKARQIIIALVEAVSSGAKLEADTIHGLLNGKRPD
jgi:hypothetical protein